MIKDVTDFKFLFVLVIDDAKDRDQEDHECGQADVHYEHVVVEVDRGEQAAVGCHALVRGRPD